MDRRSKLGGGITKLIRIGAANPVSFGRTAGTLWSSHGQDRMIDQTTERYRLIEELGSGGMGVVFRAEDTHLGRTVALKFLPTALGHDPAALERFRREARVASALNHPNICVVHDVGDLNGRPYIVMECLEGRTLKAAVADGPVPVVEAVRIATQVADALAAAHSRGIIHRDIKPANIFLTTRGEVKVMDFGLAKGTPSESMSSRPTAPPGTPPDDSVITSPGSALGTMAYMSPEQARGEPLDARTDIFSLGAVLYEMLTGRRAFAGATPALVFDGILNQAPVPVRQFAHAVPHDVVNVVNRALEKDPALRHQGAADLLADLHRAARAAGAPPRPRGAERLLRGLRGPGWAGLAALLLVVAAGFGWYGTRGRTGPALTDRDSVLLADFANATGEAVFDETLRQALAVHLGQSPFLDIVGDERVNETLQLMGRPQDGPLSHAVAREVCQRQGVKAMIEGSITPLGSNYVVALTATGCQDGDVLAREQVEAARKEEVLRALGSAATRLRGRLGESLATLRAYDTPIEQATTPSLEALKAYALALKERARGAEIESIPFLQRAIELDPDFASAWMALSTVYGNLGESARAAEFAGKAFAAREHVSERERLSITHQYYDRITGELDKSAEALALWEKSYPRDYRPSNSLAVLYNRAGQYELAIERGLEALRRNPNHPFPYSNLAHAYRSLNRYDEAKRVAMQATARRIETLPTRRLLYQIALLEGDEATAAQHREVARGRSREFDMTGAEAQLAVFEGRLEDARALYRRAAEIARASSLTEVAEGYAVHAAWMELLVGNREAAIGLARPVLDTPNVSARLGAVTVLALAGASDPASGVIEDAARRHPLDTLIQAHGIAVARAAVLLQRGQPAEAVNALRVAEPYELGRVAALQPIWLRAEAYLALRNGRAAAEYEKILAHRGVDPFSIHYRLAPLGLARSLAMQGDKAGAARAYGEFLGSWPKAGRTLPVLERARAEAARLGTEPAAAP